MIFNEFNKRIISSLILIPISFFCFLKGGIVFVILLIICCIISIYEWNKMINKKIPLYIGYIFILFSFYSFNYLRSEYNNYNLYYFFFIIICCISTDIGGFSIGKIFKGPKLTNISPNKTYSGVAGGYLFSFIVTSIYVLAYNKVTDQVHNLKFNLILMIVVISTISQIGDITISYFKRSAKIKDTGNIIPGHGGILDRIDGMLFVFPVIFILEKYL